MTFAQHVHTPRRDSSGRDICSSCQSVVITPILSSDDPRLVNAGFQRSNERNTEEIILPLPELLIWLYYNAHTIQLINAPVSWYINEVSRELHEASGGLLGVNNLDEYWTMLHTRWYEQWILSRQDNI